MQDYERVGKITDGIDDVKHLWACTTCGAIVISRDTHDFWHAQGDDDAR